MMWLNLMKCCFYVKLNFCMTHLKENILKCHSWKETTTINSVFNGRDILPMLSFLTLAHGSVPLRWEGTTVPASAIMALV